MIDLNYIAVCPGCQRLVSVVSGDCPAKDRARDVAQWMKDGLEIRQMDTESVRKADWCCKCEKKIEQKGQLDML